MLVVYILLFSLSNNFQFYLQVFLKKRPWQNTIKIKHWIKPRVIELVYTSYDMTNLAKDFGYTCPPFKWDESRRFMIRCEIDAAYFHLYSIDRDDVCYIMETFPIVKRKDIAKYGKYYTKETILSIYDDMAECIKTGNTYQTCLDPHP